MTKRATSIPVKATAKTTSLKLPAWLRVREPDAKRTVADLCRERRRIIRWIEEDIGPNVVDDFEADALIAIGNMRTLEIDEAVSRRELNTADDMREVVAMLALTAKDHTLGDRDFRMLSAVQRGLDRMR